MILADRRFALPPRSLGISGLGRPRLVPAGHDRFLVVADAPRSRYGEAAIARGLSDLDWVAPRAVAHAAIVEACLGARAVVPVKLFTIFDDDARAVADLTRGTRQLDRAIRRVAGRAEWGLRIRRSSPAAASPGPAAARTGAQYLQAKRRALDAVRREATQGRAEAEKVFRRLAGRATEAVRQTLPPAARGGAAAPLVLDAAFLVTKGQSGRFAAAVRRAAEDLDPKGYRVELTGPWPPYNFVEA